MDKKYEILCISQFTLYHVLKGNKLDFHRAMPAQESEPFYMNFLAELRKRYRPELIKGKINSCNLTYLFCDFFIPNIIII